MSLDYSQIKAYVVSVDRTTDTFDAEKLKSVNVIGLFAEAGRLFDVSHTKQSTYVNPQLDKQIQAAKDASIQYGLFPYVRARTVKEAEEELKWLQIYVQKYVPPLGVWLKLELSAKSEFNDAIIRTYTEKLEKLGLKGKIGLYATRTQLSYVDWDKWQESLYLWLISHVDDVSDLDQLLDPTFFDL